MKDSRRLAINRAGIGFSRWINGRKISRSKVHWVYTGKGDLKAVRAVIFSEGHISPCSMLVWPVSWYMLSFFIIVMGVPH